MRTRRDFVAGCAVTAGILGGVAPIGVSGQQAPTDTHPVKVLPTLPYAADALEPFIDAQTMTLHHDKHHKAYVDNLNKALAGSPKLMELSVEQLVSDIDTVPSGLRPAVRNQGGGHANHSLWWPSLKKNAGARPSGELAKAIDEKFNSFDAFQGQLTKAAVGVFGSGWAWLLLNKNGAIEIATTPNQDSPLMTGKYPIFGIDVWEHAYYLKYQNRRADYVKAFWSVVNWDFVNERYSGLRGRLAKT
jgi:superoxide dismutase, Fe-Mn family